MEKDNQVKKAKQEKEQQMDSKQHKRMETMKQKYNLVELFSGIGSQAKALNNIGIIGLSAGVDFVQSRGIGAIFTHELELCNYIYSKLKTNPEITLCTPAPDEFFSAPIISFNYGDYSSEKTAALLADRGIAVRAGLHCSPLAHTAFNTLDRGTVRVSPSVFNTRKDCEKLIFYLKNL